MEQKASQLANKVKQEARDLLRHAGDTHWDELNEKLEAAWEELHGALERVRHAVE